MRALVAAIVCLVFAVDAARRRRSRAMDDDLSPEIDLDAPEPTEILALPGRKFPLNFASGEFTINGKPIVLKEVPNSGLGTGLTVWDGSIVLSKYLEHSSMPLDGCNVLEIGSGTGAVGLAAAVLGAANVTMTDLDYTLDNLRSAVAANTAVLPDGTGVRVAELDWYHPQRFIDAQQGTAGPAAAPAATVAASIAPVGACATTSSVVVDAHAHVAPVAASVTAPIPISTGASDGVAGGGAAAAPAASVAAMDDAAAKPTFDVILGADIIWVPELIPPLVRSIAALAKNSHRALVQRKRRRAADAGAAAAVTTADTDGPTSSASPCWPCMARCAATGTSAAAEPAAAGSASAAAPTCASGSCDEWPLILIAHQTRSRASDRLFSALLAEQGFEWAPLPHADHSPAYQDRDINIMRVTPRAERAA